MLYGESGYIVKGCATVSFLVIAVKLSLIRRVTNVCGRVTNVCGPYKPDLASELNSTSRNIRETL